MKAAWAWLTSLPKWWLIPSITLALGAMWAFFRPSRPGVGGRAGLVPKPPQSIDEVDDELEEATDATEDSRSDALSRNPFRK